MRFAITMTAGAFVGLMIGMLLASRVIQAEQSDAVPNQEPPPQIKAESNPYGLSDDYEYSTEGNERYAAWTAEVLRQSEESSSYALVVNKSAFELYLLNAGVVIAAIPIELGFDPVHDKRMEGDGTTPEGVYYLTHYLDVGQTQYHRGYFIDYPNTTDQLEFAEAQASGEIPAAATIGGDIMIHGAGSGHAGNTDDGYNWTLGCIALSSDDIDKLWPHLYSGMPVAIVRYGELDLPSSL